MNCRGKWLSLLASLGVIISMALFGFAGRVNAAPVKHTAHKTAKASSIPQRCKTKQTAKGTFTYSDNQFPDNLNPYQTTLVVSVETLDLTQDGILGFNDQAKLYPDMVTTIPSVKNGGITNGGKTYTWHLKKGMLWSNGKEITSADWKFGWQVEMDQASGPACVGTCDVISRIDTPDKYTVVMHLKRVDASFLTGVHYSTIIPKSWSGLWTDAHSAANKLFQDTSYNFEGPDYPTNGPYKVDTFVTNDRIVLSPMKYYDILACGAGLKQMIFAFYSDPAGEIAAAATKATDLSQDYTFSNLSEILSHKTYKTYTTPGFQIEHMELNTDPTYNGSTNPLHNIKVRQALNLAVDKVTALQASFGIPKAQAASVAAYNFLVDTKSLRAPFADPNLTQAYDPLTKKYVTAGTSAAIKDAKKLLSQAGYPSCFSIDFGTTTAPYRIAEMSALSKQFVDLGCKVNQQPEPASKFFGQYNEGGTLATGKFQIGLFTWQVSPDPDGQKAFFEYKYCDRAQATHSPVNQNYSCINDPKYTSLFTKADSTVDNKVRTADYYQIEHLFATEVPWIPFYYRPVIATFDGKITPFKMNPTSAGLSWNAPQWKLAK
jgi:peptide/nickel transport system substrate-binding protein